jgi:hypothetical protein
MKINPVTEAEIRSITDPLNYKTQQDMTKFLVGF